MFGPGDRVGVAVSGGADSVALLHILHELSERFGIELIVLHMNHHLRGAESDGDAEFTRALAKSAGLQLIEEASAPLQRNLEATARRLRREFFACSKESHGIKKIALGHTQSDQAETVLHRLFRGSGPTGLAAMRFVTAEGLVRPLLTTGRAEVRAWATEKGFAWREDSSNADRRFTRNRLRQETIPALTEAYNQNLETVLAGSAQIIQTEEDYWQQEVEPLHELLVKRTRLGSIFQVDDLQRLHLALRRRLIRRALGEIRAERLNGLDFEHVEHILALCNSIEGHDRVVVPGADALRSFDSLLLSVAGKLGGEPRGYEISVQPDESYQLPFGAGQICICSMTPPAEVCDKFKKDRGIIVERVRLRCEVLSRGPLMVRNWGPGDELLRSGHKSAQKIKVFFQENRVRLWLRRHWPVLISGREIVWVRGCGVAEQFALSGEEPGALQLVYGVEEWARGESVL